MLWNILYSDLTWVNPNFLEMVIRTGKVILRLGFRAPIGETIHLKNQYLFKKSKYTTEHLQNNIELYKNLRNPVAQYEHFEDEFLTHNINIKIHPVMKNYYIL